MSTEQTSPAPAETTPAAPAETAPKRTLEDIYATVPNLTAQQTAPVQSHQQTAEPPRTRPETIPDPVTAPQDYAAYVAKQNEEIRRELQADRAARLADKEAERRALDKVDLKSAVETISDGVSADKDIVRGWVFARADDDPRLADLFNKRFENPGAWDAALSVLKDEAKEKFAARTDAQLVENQAALNLAMAGASTTAPKQDDETTKLLKMSPNDFAREWQTRVLRGAYDKR